MSFQPVSQYKRHILRPITPGKPYPLNPDWAKSRPLTTSNLWSATTHCFVGTGKRIIPASWHPSKFEQDPDQIPDDPKFKSNYDPESSKERSDDSSESIYHMFASSTTSDQSSERQTSTGLESDQMLAPRIIVKRHIPHQQTTMNHSNNSTVQGQTLILMAGMGLPKELFEPLMEIILEKASIQNVKIEEIWTFDMPMGGESAMINPKGYLYGIEKDIARDLLMFLTSFLPIESKQDDLPFELPIRNYDHSSTSFQHVRKNVHLIAHSMGGQASILVCSHAPEIVQSLTIIDPAIIPSGKILETYSNFDKKAFAIGLKKDYSNFDELKMEIRANKRTKRWDERIAKIFCERSAILIENEKEKLNLIAHPKLEWALYYDFQSPTNSFDRLKDIQIPLNAIMPERPFAVPVKQFEKEFETLKAKRKRLSWIQNATHQLPFEKPDEVCSLIVDWLVEENTRMNRTSKL